MATENLHADRQLGAARGAHRPERGSVQETHRVTLRMLICAGASCQVPSGGRCRLGLPVVMEQERTLSRVAELAERSATLALHNAPKTWRNPCSRPPQTGGSGTRATARVHAPLPFATLIGKATIVAPVTGRVARLANFSTCR